MIKYNKFTYFYPPRPENKIPRESIIDYNSNRFIAQPKLNGSNVVIFTDGISVIPMNRHNERMSNFNIDKEEILKLHKCEKNKWLVINGEYMNKSKKGIDNNIFNNKLVIFDILVFDSNHLVGETFNDRIELMDKLYGKNKSYDKFLYYISDNIYRVKSFTNNLQELFDELIKTDMYEGIVIKRKRAKLENGVSKKNNYMSQVKSRKKTKNYTF